MHVSSGLFIAVPAALIILSMIPAARAQSGHCDPEVKVSAGDPLRYSSRGERSENSDRCEGSYRLQVGSQALQLASFTLYVQALNGKPYPLRSGEQLQIRDHRGVIRSLDLTDDHIALQLHGTAAGLSSGIGENRRNLMPTYLEWLTTREGLDSALHSLATPTVGGALSF